MQNRDKAEGDWSNPVSNTRDPIACSNSDSNGSGRSGVHLPKVVRKAFDVVNKRVQNIFSGVSEFGR